MNYGSDNQTPASPQVLQSLLEANQGYNHGYGNDPWTDQAIAALRDVFECDIEVFFVPTGTAANCLALSALVQPWETILCHRNAHIYMDESTAPELFTGGARMVPLACGDGKLSAAHLQAYFHNANKDMPHNPQAGAVSITQSSEIGQVYTSDEIAAISEQCKQHGLKLHMDGARFANAVASLNCSPAEITWKAGVDVLCLGATKCGALCAEAVIFFNKGDAEHFNIRRKRAGHLVSKGRLFGAQFSGWLRDGHWLELARHANRQATLLAEAVSVFDAIELLWPVAANEVFVAMPKALAQHLQQAGTEFYDWYPQALPAGKQLTEEQYYARLVTSFMSSDEQREAFVAQIKKFYA